MKAYSKHECVDTAVVAAVAVLLLADDGAITATVLPILTLLSLFQQYHLHHD